MGGLEAVTFSLGVAVAKIACGVWLGDNQFAAQAGTTLIDLAAQRLLGARDQRRFKRVWEQTAELLADRIELVVAREFRGLHEHERLAAVDAAQTTFDATALTEDDLFKRDLDAGYLDRHLRSQDPDRAIRAGLSADATSLYNLLLRECCAYAIEVVRALPSAGISALTEVLRRERQVLDDLREVLERLPARRGVADFERDYRQLVANTLDHVEFFGATLTEASRRYPLSVAYLSLTVSGDFTLRRPDEPSLGLTDERPRSTMPTARVDEVLASTNRLFVRGQAGLGKTTLLQWIAVQSARGGFPERLTDWNDTVPFFVPLRRHAEGDLPSPEQFVAKAGRHIAAEMPPGWVHEQLRSGRAVVLIDGVDELTDRRRYEARRWLRELVAAFPRARYVVTSRPAAVPSEWLDKEDFNVAELEPMDRSDVREFVCRWHEAMRERCDHASERHELHSYERRLLISLDSQRHLRGLARYPLLCALLCALHRDRRGQLPGNRMELYDVALQMLLERRDRERDLDPDPALSRTDKTVLLRGIAYWLIRNGWSSAPADQVRERITARLAGMTQVDAGPDEVYRILLERSGLLREPIEGQIDFVHRSFQEYLAAAEAVDSGDIGALVDNAYTDMWSDMVVMAAGHATAQQRVSLIRGLLARASERRDPSLVHLNDSLRLLAVACLETSPELPPDLRDEVQQAAESLLPPKTMAAAQSLARTGTFTLDLLARTKPRKAPEVAATIRAASDMDEPAALPLLARFGKDRRKAVVKELLRAWARFDPEEYARTVLREHPLIDGWCEIRDPRMIPALRHLRNLRRLQYHPPDLSPVDPSFVRELPNLQALWAIDFTDLNPLAECKLEVVTQALYGIHESPPLSLAPLAEATTLTDVAICGRSVTGLPALHRLDRLVRLSLDALDTCDALEELVPLSRLAMLSIGGMADLRDLEALRFLNCPDTIQALWCPTLSDISALKQWTPTLRSLRLESCPSVDLAPLRDLRSLGFVNLWGSGALDLSPVADLPELKWVVLGGEPVPDLRPLSACSGLSELSVLHTAEFDLSPLAGREGLTVQVERSTTVHGVEQLGPGSRLIRRS